MELFSKFISLALSAVTWDISLMAISQMSSSTPQVFHPLFIPFFQFLIKEPGERASEKKNPSISGKQKGVAAEGNLKILQQSEGEMITRLEVCFVIEPFSQPLIIDAQPISTLLPSQLPYYVDLPLSPPCTNSPSSPLPKSPSPAPIAEEPIISVYIPETGEQQEEETSLQTPHRPSVVPCTEAEESKRYADLVAQLNKSRIQIPSRSEPEDELSFLTDAEREESIKTEKAIADHKKSLRLAITLDNQQLSEANIKKKNPIDVQAQLLKRAEEENKKEVTRQEKELSWCQKKIDERLSPHKITNATVTGRPKDGGVMVTMNIFRDNNTYITDYPSHLQRYGFDEWIEIRDAIQKSKSKYKEYVEDQLNKLFNKVSKIVKIPPLPLKPTHRRKSTQAEDDPCPLSKEEIMFIIENQNMDPYYDI